MSRKQMQAETFKLVSEEIQEVLLSLKLKAKYVTIVEFGACNHYWKHENQSKLLNLSFNLIY